MKITVIAFGKLKTPGMREASDYFLQASKLFTPVFEKELKPVSPADKSKAARIKVQEAEEKILAEFLEKNFSARRKLFLLDETGRQLRSKEWSTALVECKDQSTADVIFVVGSSFGFSDAMRLSAHFIFSLGPQTLSHELARVVLYEQLFRAQSISNSHPYHNEG